MDRYIQFAAAAGIEAITDSGLDLEVLDRERMGVTLGSAVGGTMVLEDGYGKDVIALDYRRPGIQDLARGGRRDRRQPAGAGAAALQARHDHLGRDRARGLRGHRRADHARRGRDRRAPARPARLRRAARGGRRAARRGARARSTCSRGCAAASSRARRVIVGFDDTAGGDRVRLLRRGPGGEPGGPGHARSHDLHQAAAVLRADLDRRGRPGGDVDGGGARGRALRARLHRLLRRPSRRRGRAAGSAAAGGAGAGARHVHRRQGRAHGRASSTTSTTTRSR